MRSTVRDFKQMPSYVKCAVFLGIATGPIFQLPIHPALFCIFLKATRPCTFETSKTSHRQNTYQHSHIRKESCFSKQQTDLQLDPCIGAMVHDIASIHWLAWTGQAWARMLISPKSSGDCIW